MEERKWYKPTRADGPPGQSDQTVKRRQHLFLALVLLLGAVSGCHVGNQPAQFSEVPDSALDPAKPRKTMTELDILGARPGMERAALVKGILKALGPPSDNYREEEKAGDAQKLADRVLAGNKVTLRLHPDLAKELARSLGEAGLIVKLSE